MARQTVGIIITPPGAFVDKHEKLTADYIATILGFNVTFLAPSRRSGAKTPDITMNGRLWEIKCPYGKSSRTIENNLRLALLQSPYIILDLRRLDGRIPTNKQVSEAERQFNLAKGIKHLIVITREDNHVDFER